MVAVEESKVWPTNPVLFRPIINRARQIRASLGATLWMVSNEGRRVRRADQYGGKSSKEGRQVWRAVKYGGKSSTEGSQVWRAVK
jgi:hypothetical protein